MDALGELLGEVLAELLGDRDGDGEEDADGAKGEGIAVAVGRGVLGV